MVAHGSRYTDTSWRTLGLKSCRNIHRVTVQVCPIGNCVTKVDPDAKAHGAFSGMVAVKDRNLLLHRDGTAHRPVNAIEYDEERVAAGLNDPAAMLINRWIDHPSAYCTQPFE